MSKTLLNKIKIEKFRALENVDIELGNNITLICGKNGTAKSSILGIAAQIFSFEKDYTTNKLLDYKTITGDSFKSKFNEHFRISQKYDTTGTMKISLELYDAYSETDATGKLTLTMRDNKPRAVVRENSLAKKGENSARNFTHPVIFLSLKRLYPIAERNSYKEFDYLKTEEKRKRFINLSNELLNPMKPSSKSTGTNGSIKSAVAYGDNYDCNSVSAGEDNVGQIILAIMSFEKLKEEYKDYKGGLLLIDEADAALFPAAQISLIKILERECEKLNLQVVMTSHSITLMDEIFKKNKERPRLYRTAYLTNTYGSLEIKYDWGLRNIYADVSIKTIPMSKESPLPKINVYFEDREAVDMFKKIMHRNPVNKNLNIFSDISLSCTNYISLAKKNIPEFSKKSIICLDADVKEKDIKKLKSIILLPGELPPDQLIFEFLYNLDANDKIWLNDDIIQYTKAIFNRDTISIVQKLDIKDSQINLKDFTPRPRELFKNFYKSEDFQSFLKQQSNPWKHWIIKNQDICDKFVKKFTDMVERIIKPEGKK
jgi:predicted ATPase